MADRREIMAAKEDFAAKVAELDRIEAQTLAKQAEAARAAEVAAMFDAIHVPEPQEAPTPSREELLSVFDMLPPRVEDEVTTAEALAPEPADPGEPPAPVADPVPVVSPAPADGVETKKGFFGSLAAPATDPQEGRVGTIDEQLERIQGLKTRQHSDGNN